MLPYLEVFIKKSKDYVDIAGVGSNCILENKKDKGTNLTYAANSTKRKHDRWELNPNNRGQILIEIGPHGGRTHDFRVISTTRLAVSSSSANMGD